jgi:hypothetical protein
MCVIMTFLYMHIMYFDHSHSLFHFLFITKGFELKTLHLLSQQEPLEPRLQPFFALVILEIGSHSPLPKAGLDRDPPILHFLRLLG